MLRTRAENYNKLFTLSKIGVFVLFLESLKAWFFWKGEILIICTAISFCVPFAFFSRDIFSFDRKTLLPLTILFLTIAYSTKSQNLNAFIYQAGRFTVVAYVMLLKNSLKIEILEFITKAFSLLLLFSLLGWIMFLLGFNLPSVQSTYGDTYFYHNHFLFLDNIGISAVDLPLK